MSTKHGKSEKPDIDTLQELGYERTDISMPAVGRATLWFFVFAIACLAASGVILWAMNREAFAAKDPDKPFGVNMPKGNNPILQSNVTAKADIQKMRQAEEARLTGTGWVNQSKGIVHIPIERAIDQIAERGIAPTGKAVTAVSTGNTIPQNALPKPATP